MRTYIYKLRPSKSQAAALMDTLETCRRLHNRALSERKDAWEMDQRSISFYEQSAALPAQKRDNPYLAAAPSTVLIQSLRRLDRAFQAFFRRVQAGEGKVGYPRFKGRGWYDSFCYPQWGKGASFRGGRLVLSKIGEVRVCADRPLAGTPKTCTVVRKADGWYAHIACEVEGQPQPPTGETVGVDVGLTCFATLSTGETIANPRCYRRAEHRLKRAQRRLSRRVKGGKRRAKARELLAKAHLKVRRQRRDFHHKTARSLVNRFDTIVVEDLNIRGMLRNHILAKHIADAGWYQFRTGLSEKAASAARVVVAVNPAGTSQRCSRCAGHVPKSLADRWHSCPYCRCELDRDHNAALNIWQGGGTALGEPTALAAAMNREPHTR